MKSLFVSLGLKRGKKYLLDPPNTPAPVRTRAGCVVDAHPSHAGGGRGGGEKGRYRHAPKIQNPFIQHEWSNKFIWSKGFISFTFTIYLTRKCRGTSSHLPWTSPSLWGFPCTLKKRAPGSILSSSLLRCISRWKKRRESYQKTRSVCV